jgi:hypothetical protein
MSVTEAVIEGTLKPDGTLELDEKPNLPPGRATVVLRQERAASASQPLGESFFRAMGEIWTAQEARGFVPRTVEEVEAERQRLRAEMEQEIAAAEDLREQCLRERGQRSDGEGSP